MSGMRTTNEVYVALLTGNRAIFFAQFHRAAPSYRSNGLSRAMLRRLSLGQVALAVVVAIVALYLTWDIIERIMNDLVKLAAWLIGIVIFCAFAYQSYDAFRSGLTGTQPTESKEVDDPRSWSNRLAAIVWGLMAGCIAFLLAAIGLDWDWFFRWLFS